MATSQKRGMGRLLAASRYSAAGLRAAWRHEEAFRQEVLLALILIPAALWLGETMLERAVLIGSVLMVLITELLNSAIEAVVDRIGRDQHELSCRAKDMGSAAVLLSLIVAAAIWLAIAWDRFAGVVA